MGKNVMKFILKDGTNKNEYNESCEMVKSWYSTPEEVGIMSIEDYYYLCRQFAAAMGFGEKTIDEWFGEC
jgi:hypothetical protein